jgi:ASPIC/UnbV protein
VPRWQLREIASNTGYGGQSALVVHFGLGDAAVADTVRFEWPSGQVDVLTSVAADTLLSIVEGQTTADVPVSSGSEASGRIQIMPSPLAGRGSVAFWSAHTGSARVTLHDVQGRCVRTVFDGVVPAGWSNEPLDRAWLSRSGVYWIRLSTADGTWARPVVAIR